MSFQFDQYQEESAAKAQLDQLLPPGTDINQFKSFMESVGARCNDPSPSSDNKIFCYYVRKQLFIHTQWIVSAPVNEFQKIGEIQVVRGLTGM